MARAICSEARLSTPRCAQRRGQVELVNRSLVVLNQCLAGVLFDGGKPQRTARSTVRLCLKPCAKAGVVAHTDDRRGGAGCRLAPRLQLGGHSPVDEACKGQGRSQLTAGAAELGAGGLTAAACEDLVTEVTPAVQASGNCTEVQEEARRLVQRPDQLRERRRAVRLKRRRQELQSGVPYCATVLEVMAIPAGGERPPGVREEVQPAAHDGILWQGHGGLAAGQALAFQCPRGSGKLGAGEDDAGVGFALPEVQGCNN
mmetsp:Transcript_98543/g.317726  ORF Transcript_98543/g.317726 Transcript_98543/m.317726 type:complete len:258 (+) Transcript_98543:267-1040(+)